MDWYQAATIIRENTWANRDEVLDYLLLHDCVMKKAAEAGILLVGWEVADFILAALADDNSSLRMVAGE